MSIERAAIILCVAAVVLAIFGCIVQHQTRRERGLPRPADDDRDWSGAFMRDVKRWTR